MFAGGFKLGSSQTAPALSPDTVQTDRQGGEDYLNSAKDTNIRKAFTVTGKFKKRVKQGVVPIIGVELMTYRLQGGCSTN